MAATKPTKVPLLKGKQLTLVNFIDGKATLPFVSIVNGLQLNLGDGVTVTTEKPSDMNIAIAATGTVVIDTEGYGTEFTVVTPAPKTNTGKSGCSKPATRSLLD